jgi:DNA-binding transcriptional LysR family regulator
LVAVRVGEPSRFLAVASPDYIAAHGRPQRPADLARHNCILLRTKAGGRYPWEFMDGQRRIEAQVTGSLVTDNGNLILSAAADGAGIAYVIETYARPLLESGDLEPLLEEHAAPFPGFFLYYPSRRHMPLPLKLFAEFLTSCPEAPGRRPLSREKAADRAFQPIA